MSSLSNEAAASLGVSSASHAAYVAEPIVCPQCGKPSGPQSRFCGDCGVRLWEPCPKCGEAGAINLKYCGGCGDSVPDSLSSMRVYLEELVEKCEGLAVQGDFVQACALLDEVTPIEHTQLAPLFSKVKQKSEELTQRRQAAVDRSTELLEEAKQLSQEGRVRDALAKVLETPSGLRNGEMRDLEETLQTRVRQADQLRKQLKLGLKEKKYSGLAEVAEKLLELEPDDQQVAELAKKLRAKQTQLNSQASVSLLQKACDNLDRNEYRAAQQALEQMPNGEVGQQHQKTLCGAKERVWLAMHLARTPYVEPSAIKCGERLVRLQPQDEKAQSLLESLVKRRREGMKSAPGQPTAWRKPRQGATSLGPPVAASPCPPALARYAASHNLQASQALLAYGFALQALGEAACQIDLTPKKKSWLPLPGGRARPAPGGGWGIDLGSSSLKAVHLVSGEDGVEVREAVCVPYDRPGEDRKKAELSFATPPYMAEAIERLLTDRDLSKADVVIGLPGPWTLSRSFTLPVLNEAKFNEAVRYEARMRIPLEPDSVVFDQIVTPLPAEDDLESRSVTLVACAKSQIGSVLERFQSHKFRSLRVGSDCVGLLSAAEALTDGREAQQTVAMVQVGAKTTNLAIKHDRGCWVRGLYHGADSYDHLLVKGMQLGWEVAEKTRREPWRAAWMHELDQTLQPGLDELAAALRRSFAQFENEQQAQIDKVLVCGGAAAQLGLMPRLTSGE